MDLNKFVVVRGGGDIATGTIARLHLCGYQVLILEVKKPTAIRRTVSFCEAVYEQSVTVEGITAKLVDNISEIKSVWKRGNVPLIIDPQATIVQSYKPLALIDAIIAKHNIGTKIDMAKITIALGPGFIAGQDVDAVIETKRGHNLGKVITVGKAEENTGIPGAVNGISLERVIHSKTDGVWKVIKDIGEIVQKGDIIAYVDLTPIHATIDGLIRGMIRNKYLVYKGLKVADIDPRISEKENCYTISDKARCISGSVLETILKYEKES